MSASSESASKKSMSWIDIKVWIAEQRENIVGSYIDNVYYLHNTLLIRLKNSSRNLDTWLLAEAGRRIHLLTTGSKPIIEGDRSTVLWRRFLRDCYVENIYQYDNERVVLFDIRCRDSNAKSIVVELLPRGVIAILDSDKRVLLASEYREMRDRVIKRGEVYSLPPLKSSGISLEKLLSISQSGVSLGKLVKEYGLPPEVVNSAAVLCSIDRASTLRDRDVECIVNTVNKIVESSLSNPTPCIVYRDNEAVGFYPFIPPIYSGGEYRVEVKKTFNEVLEQYFFTYTEELLSSKRVSELALEIEKLKKSLESIDKRVEELRKELENLKTKLSCVEVHYASLDEVHRCVSEHVKKRGWESIKECGSIVFFDRSTGSYTVSIDNCLVDLNVRYELVNLYNDLRKTVVSIEKSIEKALNDRKRIEEEVAKISAKIAEERRKIGVRLSVKKNWYEKFHWIVTSSGFLIIGGRDASQNIQLIKRFLNDRDIVLHADIHGASTVIIKTGGREVDEETLHEAALMAACYSKAWKSGLAAVDVFWVYGSQISLSPPSGEYLPKGSFMVYGKKNYIRSVELRLAIGINIDDKGVKVVIGSENHVSKNSLAYAVLIPGDQSPATVVEQFINSLRDRNVVESGLLELIRDEFIKEIPGKSRIVNLVVRTSSGVDNAESL